MKLRRSGLGWKVCVTTLLEYSASPNASRLSPSLKVNVPLKVPSSRLGTRPTAVLLS
jgi:hypothetical protein